MKFNFRYEGNPRHTTVEIIDDTTGGIITTATVVRHANDKDVKFLARRAALKEAITYMTREQRIAVWHAWHFQEGRGHWKFR